MSGEARFWALMSLIVAIVGLWFMYIQVILAQRGSVITNQAGEVTTITQPASTHTVNLSPTETSSQNLSAPAGSSKYFTNKFPPAESSSQARIINRDSVINYNLPKLKTALNAREQDISQSISGSALEEFQNSEEIWREKVSSVCSNANDQQECLGEAYSLRLGSIENGKW